MANNLFKYFLLCFVVSSFLTYGQEKKKIRVTAPYYDKNETEYPGATILTRNSKKQIYIEHEGIEMWCDKAYHYSKEDSISAFGNVLIKQGDTIKLTSKVANYSGQTKLAFSAGNVVLTEPKSTLRTDTLYFDRIKQIAYYKSGGVVNHEESIIKSYVGKYYTQGQKYQFISTVDIKNLEYTLTSSQLDFYSNSGFAYLYGKSKIVHETSTIFCERGFYDTKADLGYFIKNSKILYSNRIFEGDSMYFNQKRNFASATNNIKVTDTLNNSIVTGHYAEVFRDKDSVFITKRALAKTFQENDSIYIHADTLMITGKPEKRIIRGFHDAKLFKSDINGKCDSIHVNQQTGITKLIKNPILWSGENQITGDTIKLINNRKENKLDSLFVYQNTFLIEKDSISGFNQIKGQELTGLFNDDNKLYQIDIDKNAEHIFYARKEGGELVGIDKRACSSINIMIEENEIVELTHIGNPKAELTPDSIFPKNARTLRGFNWRGDERILTIEDLFKNEPPIKLTKIRGLDDRIFEPDVSDLKSISQLKKQAKPSEKTSNAELDLTPKKTSNLSKSDKIKKLKSFKKLKPSQKE